MEQSTKDPNWNAEEYLAGIERQRWAEDAQGKPSLYLKNVTAAPSGCKLYRLELTPVGLFRRSRKYKTAMREKQNAGKKPIAREARGVALIKTLP